MCEQVNINVSETNETINIVSSEIQEVIDINVFETTEDVTLNITEEIIQVNVNKVTAAEQIQSDWNQTNVDALDFIKNKPTSTSDFINDGSDGVNPFITAADIPPVTGFVPYTGATANVDLGEYELKAGQVTLDTSPTGTAAVATTRWNNTIGSTETTLKGGSVVLKNGVDLVARVVNKVTPNATLTKAAYQAVRISGAQGQRLAVAYAQANNDNNSADTIGIVCETIATNQEGFILTVGQLEEINTTGSLQGETWADGDVLYLSPTTAGRLTNIKPTGATGHIVVMGYVEYAHAIHGKIYVKIMNGWELDELHNVFINSPANNEGLFYDSADSLWKNETIASALGYTPVTDARTISTTAPLSGGGDLSANRTLSITQASTSTDGYLSSTDWNTFNNKFTLPALTSGSVLFSNGTTIAQDNEGLFYDQTNKRFILRSNTQALRGFVQEDYGNTAGAAAMVFQKSRGTFASPLNVNANDLVGAFVFRARVGGAFTDDRSLFGANMATSTGMGMYFITGSTNANYIPSLYIHPTGNIAIGSTQSILTGITDAGYKLDVNGTARVKAQSALSTEVTFSVRNSANTRNFLVVNGAGDVFNNGAGGVTSNTFFGENAGRLSSGISNSFFGNGAGAATSTGQSNSFFGLNSGLSNAGGNFNSFFGNLSGQANTSGVSNSYVGRLAGQNNNGSNNSFIGSQSGRFLSDGITGLSSAENSVFIGFDTRANANSQTNQIVIGYQAIGAGSNTATLGNTSIVDTILRGRVNIQQYATGSRPTYVKGALIYDSTLGKLVVGGNAGWKVKY